jgi:hypothetical protein
LGLVWLVWPVGDGPIWLGTSAGQVGLGPSDG